MKDPTVPHVSNRKKFMFYDTDQRQAALRIRCKYDGINQSQFFRMMITGYLENDSNILNYLDLCKEKYKLQGQAKRKYIKNMHKAADDTKKKFALNEDEIESIFDIIGEV